MTISKSDALAATFSRPELRFEQQDLTCFTGLVLFQSLFARLGLYRRLARCFRKRVACPIYPQAKIILYQIQERPAQLLPVVLHRCTDRTGTRGAESLGQRARFQWGQGFFA